MSSLKPAGEAFSSTIMSADYGAVKDPGAELGQKGLQPQQSIAYHNAFPYFKHRVEAMYKVMITAS